MRTLDQELLRAAEILEREASVYSASYTVRGQWPILDDVDRQAKAAHDEMLAIAKRFRALAVSIQ